MLAPTFTDGPSLIEALLDDQQRTTAVEKPLMFTERTILYGIAGLLTVAINLPLLALFIDLRVAIPLVIVPSLSSLNPSST